MKKHLVPMLTVVPSTREFLRIHSLAKDQLRLGQRFVIKYIKEPWPELFYADGEAKAVAMINTWLKSNHYINELPQELERTR